MIGNILLSLLPVLIVVIVFVTGFSWYLARSSLKPIRTPKSKTPADFDLPFEDLSIHSNGHTLHGWFIPARRQPAPTIILVHSWERSAEEMLPHAEYLFELRCNLMLFDMRGHGDSDIVKNVTINHLINDLDAAVNYVFDRPQWSQKGVGILGHALGGALAIIKASRDNRIQALVSSSGLTDFNELIALILHWRKLPVFPFRMLIEKFWRHEADALLDTVTPLEQIGKLSFPMLLVHGEHDSVIPVAHVERLHKNSVSAEKFIVEGKGHSELHEDEGYQTKVRTYFRERLLER